MTGFALRAILALALVACAAPAQAQGQKLIPLRVGYDGFSMTTSPMNYTLQKGIFKKYGLDVTLVYVDGGSTLSQAVVGGSLDIAQNGYTPAALAAVSGADIVFIGGISNKLPFQLVVKKTITNAATLKGKRIAISRLGSSTDAAAKFALRSLGLTRSDVIVLQLGGEATRTAAMASGQIDGSFEQYPRTAELEQQGFRVLVDCTQVAGDYPNTSYVSTRRFLKAHSDVAKRFLMAITDGLHQFKTHKPEALKLTAAFLKMKNGPALSKAYDEFTQYIFPDIPYPSVHGVSLILDQLKATVPRAASFTPEQLIDTSALDALKKEGFFAKLK